PKLVSGCAEWIEATARGFDPGFVKRYRHAIHLHHDSFNVRGLGLINTYSLKLEKVFVDLRITASANPGMPNFDPIAGLDLTGPRQIWDLIRSKAAFGDGVALAIIGPPGSGKSTLLQHLTLTLVAKRQRRYRVR